MAKKNRKRMVQCWIYITWKKLIRERNTRVHNMSENGVNQSKAPTHLRYQVNIKNKSGPKISQHIRIISLKRKKKQYKTIPWNFFEAYNI